MRRSERDDPPDIVGDAYSLFFRVTSAPRCYTASEYLDWREAAGFTEVQLQPMPVAPSQLLATGGRQASFVRPSVVPTLDVGAGLRRRR